MRIFSEPTITLGTVDPKMIKTRSYSQEAEGLAVERDFVAAQCSECLYEYRSHKGRRD